MGQQEDIHPPRAGERSHHDKESAPAKGSRHRRAPGAVLSKQQLEAVLESLPLGVVVFDVRGEQIRANQIFERTRGGSRLLPQSIEDYAAYKAWWADTGRQVAPQEWAAVRALQQGETVIGQELQIERFDGQRVFVLNSAAPVRDAQGAIIGCAATLQDITAQKQAELALRESEHRMQQALSVSRSFAFEWHPLTDRVLRSASCATILDLDGNDVCDDTSQRYFRRVHPDDRVRLAQTLRALTPAANTYHTEYRIARGDGGEAVLEEIGQAFFDDAGQLQRLVGVCTDITERKQAEEQVRRLNATLEQRVIERTVEARQRARQLQRLAAQMAQTEERERRRLAHLLHDQLQQSLVAAKLRLGATERRIPDARAAAAVAEAVGLIDEAIAESRSLARELNPPVLYDAGLVASLEWLGREQSRRYHLPLLVQAEATAEPDDPTLKVFVFQAARELILNAVKHAQASLIKVQLTRREDDRLQLVIEDDGQGFDPSVLTAAGREEGWGFFSIRERLELIGGDLSIDSAPTQGTRVTITTPCKSRYAPAPPRAPVDAPPPTGIRVLLADDHPVLRKGLADMLMDYPGLNVVGEAPDGQEAVALALRLRPDVVLMDIEMPHLNGIEATRRLRQTAPEIAVIGLSMHENEELVATMRLAGAKGYVTKTSPIEELVAAILHACPRQPPG